LSAPRSFGRIVSTSNVARRVPFFGRETANVGFLRTRAAGRKTRATGNPAPIRNGPRRCVRRKRAASRFQLFSLRERFFRKIFVVFASVRVAVIDALRRVGRFELGGVRSSDDNLSAAKLFSRRFQKIQTFRRPPPTFRVEKTGKKDSVSQKTFPRL
jgi:hypothetical protein